MIDIKLLKKDLNLVAKALKDLKASLRVPGKNPTWEETLVLTKAKNRFTKLCVLRASMKNKHHVGNKSCAWHNDIITELLEEYELPEVK